MKTYLFIFLSTFFLLSCSLESQLKGKWQAENGTQTIEFFKDRTVIANTYGIPVTGTYKNLGGNRVIFRGVGKLFGIAGAQPAIVTIKDKTLILTFDIGLTFTYVKVK